MSELHRGMELKNQLHNSNSNPNCGFLIREIVSCYDNALALLVSLHTQESTHFNPTNEAFSFSQDFKHHALADVPKKRKSLSRWSAEVLENVQHEDGFNWRKYGQKGILGATHPRSYYRCTHRHTQGCLATKQVQRGEDGDRMLKIVYRGKHSFAAKQNKQNVKAQQFKHENILTQTLSEPTLEPYFSNDFT